MTEGKKKKPSRLVMNIARALVFLWVAINAYTVMMKGPREAAASLFAAVFSLMVLVWSFWPKKEKK